MNFIIMINFFYHPKDSGIWRVHVTVSRTDGKSLSSGKCSNASSDANYGNFTDILKPFRRYALLEPGVCMEKGVSYFVRVLHLRDDSNKDGVDTVLPDSVRDSSCFLLSFFFFFFNQALSKQLLPCFGGKLSLG